MINLSSARKPSVNYRNAKVAAHANRLSWHQQQMINEMAEEINSYFPGAISMQSAVSHNSNRIDDIINMEMQRISTLRLSPIRVEAESKMTVSDRV